MPRMSADDLSLAAEWLDSYEDVPGSSGEQAACQRVAEFLRREIDRRILTEKRAAFLARQSRRL